MCNGSKCSSEPGKGGYTSGIINLIKGETLYVCVGGKGSDGVKGVNSSGGYNGGGLGTWDNSDDETSGGGGGATDIRLVDGTWDNVEGLNSRIMVAAGGGGDSWTFGGGSGGGLIGRTTYSSNSVGTQTSGYAFGKGQNASGVGESDGVGGGGSGYYGGYATDDYYSAGTGGSSFISGYAGVNAITSSSSRTHTNDTLHYSGKYFVDGEMEIGVNTGNGKAVITYISKSKPERKNTSLNNVRYIKECLNGSTSSIYNSLGELEAIYNGVNVAKGLIVKLYNADGTEVSGYNSTSFSKMTDGDIETNDNYGATYSGDQCYVLDLEETYDLDEVAVWHKWTDGRTYYDNYTYVSSDNENWTLVIDKQEPETSEGKRVNAYEEINTKYIFTYTGECEEYTVEKTGYYKLEAWGASGGNTSSTSGGKGGYASGITKLIKGETLYVCVGGKGSTSTAANQTVAGGFNGGGAALNRNADGGLRYVTSGGGATDFRLVGGSWDNEEGLNSRIMVAGGGGGAHYFSGNYYSSGGNAGGLISATGSNYFSGTIYTADLATQTSPYFGYGLSAPSTEKPGAGSGYYGGSIYVFATSGGSSFISGYAGVNAITSSSDRTHTNNTLHYSDKYFINGSMKSGVRTGNGKAVITYIDEEKPERKNTSLNNIRYIKDCATGNSTTPTYKSWLQLQAIYNGVNVALGKTVTGTGEIYSDDSGTIWSYDYVTDGIIDNQKSAYTRVEGNQCITVDLEKEYDLDEIAVWHWFSDGRTYYDNYTYVSSDNTNWIKVIDKEEPETSEGKRVNAYEGISLKINQKKGGALTCTNNTTNQISTSLLNVNYGDSLTCSITVEDNYKFLSLKLNNETFNVDEPFTYNYSDDSTIEASLYQYCSEVTTYKADDWSSCSQSCGGGIKARIAYYKDKNYSDYDCGSATETTSCNTNSCAAYCYKVSASKGLNCRTGKGTGYSVKTTLYAYEYYMFKTDSSGWYYSTAYGCYASSDYLTYYGTSCPSSGSSSGGSSGGSSGSGSSSCTYSCASAYQKVGSWCYQKCTGEAICKAKCGSGNYALSGTGTTASGYCLSGGVAATCS